jgi:hypothetical protein
VVVAEVDDDFEIYGKRAVFARCPPSQQYGYRMQRWLHDRKYGAEDD